MNDTLKSLTAALAAANRELQEHQRSIAEASRRRDTLAGDLAALDAALEAAEIAHANALAAEQIGEPADSKTTAAALEKARAALAGKPELTQRHRIAAAVVEGLERRYLEAHGRAEALNEQHRAALVAELEHRADEAMDEARALVDGLVEKSVQLHALRGLLVEQGATWNRVGIALHDAMLSPAPTAIALTTEFIRNELSV